MLLAELFIDRVTWMAIEVHWRAAGLLESVYELYRSRKLADAGIALTRQVTILVVYESATPATPTINTIEAFACWSHTVILPQMHADECR